jgi:hypothetical protein
VNSHRPDNGAGVLGIEVRARMELSPQQPWAGTPVAAVIPPVTPVIAPVLPAVAAIIAAVFAPVMPPHRAK